MAFLMQLVVADYIQSELQLKAGREKGDLEELEGEVTLNTTCPELHHQFCQRLTGSISVLVTFMGEGMNEQSAF